ncbi:antibiotic biosynthesis monooxygenase family protein [Enhygromyxa salina]|nr:antibiotic biosynthesis monooxygenase family protein [Enhygromyxa salina]
MSRFVVANGMGEQVRAAFLDRPHFVDQARGFVRMEVLIPHDQPAEFWLMTWWTDEDSFRTWHRGHTFRDSHAGIPRGLKLDPKQTSLRMFNQLCR